jgi:hypothetical protein
MTGLIVFYDTDDGVRRLLEQPADVAGRLDAKRRRGFRDASNRHRELFEIYQGDMKTAYGVAAPWWSATIEALAREEELDHEEAVEASFDSRLAGAASHPNVVWLIRSYWLVCEEANAEVKRQVDPEVFLLQWLIDAGETELVRLIACMPYWPIGLDENGNWC